MELEGELVTNKLELTLSKIAAELDEVKSKATTETEKQSALDITHHAELSRRKEIAEQDQAVARAKAELELSKLTAETQATIDRFGAAQGQFSEALLTLGNQEMLEKVAQALSVNTMIGGKNVTEVLGRVFQGRLWRA